MSQQITVLEQILIDIAEELYKQWVAKVPQTERTDLSDRILQKNAQETTVYIVQTFMDKFNAAAEELKDK